MKTLILNGPKIGGAYIDLSFTPNLNDSVKNYFHTDIYDRALKDVTKLGIANPAYINYRREILKGQFRIYKQGEENFTKESIV